MKLSKINGLIVIGFICIFMFIKSEISVDFLQQMQFENDPEFLSKMSVWVDLNHKDNLGYSFLHYAVNRGSWVLTRNFLFMGANPNIQNNEGITPLHLACMYGMVYITRDLIHFGANVNIKDKAGKTPIFYAVDRGSIDVVKLLYKNGANLNIVDSSGATLLDKAIFRNYKNIVYFLVARGESFYNRKPNLLMPFLMKYNQFMNSKYFPYYRFFEHNILELMLLKIHASFFYGINAIPFTLQVYNQKVRPVADYFFRWLPNPDDV